MTKFKVGDTVERVLNVGDAHYFSRQVGLGPYVVTSVSPTGKWLGINGWVDDKGDKEPWHAINFTLLEQHDDPLPPAPESALYNDEYHDRRVYKQTWLRAYPDCVGTLLVLQSGQYGEPAAGFSVRISPDAALQLAHDLTRMAMEIKRKEKQRG